MEIGFYFDQTRCIGCYTCMVACKDWHDIEAGPVKWIKVDAIEKGKYPELYLGYMFKACLHCAEPLCAKACPVDAITKRQEDGIVIVDREICIGGEKCKFACRKACPYDVPQFGVDDNPKMQKCDLCLERWAENKKPVCVEACPMRALDVGPIDELKAKYGDIQETVGFAYSERTRPSIVFRPKPPDPSVNYSSSEDVA
jgi:anaerobic dimethyl sulfoxide reductase subunit B (iron-sulfur subunit)